MSEACDCYTCIEQELKEESLTERTYNVTCTCYARYSNENHEHDCDLWLLEEFFMGWLAWDPWTEALHQTDAHPNQGRHYTDEDGDDWVADYYAQKDASEDYMTQEERDIALTTDKFIERMMENRPEDAEVSWVKDDHGEWVQSTQSGYSTTSARLPGDYDDWRYEDTYDWQKYMSDRHCETAVPMPSGTVEVFATSSSLDGSRKGMDPDFGIYADACWSGVPWIHLMLPWRDFGLPTVPYDFVEHVIKMGYERAKAGYSVEIGCIGAHGRTGTILACMALLDDPTLDAKGAINYVRIAFCHHAIESLSQEWFVKRFEARMKGFEVPPEPVYTPPTARVVTASTPKEYPAPAPVSKNAACNSTNTPDPNKPGRKKRSRRSKRGGKANRARQYARR